MGRVFWGCYDCKMLQDKTHSMTDARLFFVKKETFGFRLQSVLKKALLEDNKEQNLF